MADSEQTAVVTGAAGGIGRAIAEQLADDGFHVVVVDVDDGSETVESIRAANGSAEYRAGDVTDEDRMETVYSDVDIDALVNNAAVYGPLVENKRRFDEIDRTEWQRVLDVNVTGVFVSSKAALPSMSDGSRIVNIGSNSTVLGVPGFLHYVASKGAIASMTRAMATELGDVGIRVNAVLPGLTMTEATLQNDDEYIEELVSRQAVERPLEPEDVASAVAFLVSEDSDPTTGQLLSVDPGQAYY